MKKYAASFEVQDKMRFSKASREIIEKRQKQMSVFTEYRKRMIEQFESEKEQRLRLRGGECECQNRVCYSLIVMEYFELSPLFPDVILCLYCSKFVCLFTYILFFPLS